MYHVAGELKIIKATLTRINPFSENFEVLTQDCDVINSRYHNLLKNPV